MIAALFVEKGGVYWDLEDVDPWDEARDARLYAGPYPVVTHPPCARWSRLAFIHQSRFPIGDDGGCFEAALRCVRDYGGVLEHPAGSLAWKRYGLPRPARWAWTGTLDDPGLVTEVDQAAYGHEARKRTWLYCVGVEPPRLDWRALQGAKKVANMNTHAGQAARTPEAFRDVLLSMARSAQRASVFGLLASGDPEATA